MMIVSLVILSVVFFNYAHAESDNLQVNVLAGSSNQDHKIKSFYPPILPMTPGDTITWVNNDSVTHSITSGVPDHPDYYGKFFKTGNIAPSKSVTLTINDTASFAYYYLCEIHPWLTGKIVVTTAPESQPETSNPIVTDKPKYDIGQTVAINGQVHKDFAKTPYQILVYENSYRLVDSINGVFDENASYTKTISTSDMTSSKYTLKVVYGLPTQVGITTFSLDATKVMIPAWIKNGAKWWASGQISDAEFIDAIEYLTKENIIVIQKTQSIQHVSTIPSWLKTNASWWADNRISDDDFVKGLQYLVNAGIVQV